jgi:hypothetical protein
VIPAPRRAPGSSYSVPHTKNNPDEFLACDPEAAQLYSLCAIGIPSSPEIPAGLPGLPSVKMGKRGQWDAIDWRKRRPFLNKVQVRARFRALVPPSCAFTSFEATVIRCC